jgi:hypothetical protein
MASNLPARTSVDRLLRDEEALPRDDDDEPFLDSDGIARVLRNCYLLLALSLVPTVLGAWAGLSTELSSVAPRMSLGSKDYYITRTRYPFFMACPCRRSSDLSQYTSPLAL